MAALLHHQISPSSDPSADAG
ncbi:hypothetical protein RvY_19498 [Ramazzottius varieornatus]|uniref:Uncharacterized protein n=1 Tax=Ramazzottius varieornatus TaxID=947166 RepID=A0A1D1W9H2_RAMVA|nr:hypothetical protein RvY_19498 [Ramazzottius varieornatus]